MTDHALGDPGRVDTATISENERKFHLEEYKMVWRRLEISFDKFQQMPTYAALGSVGVFSWLATHQVGPGYRIMVAMTWMLPFALTFFLLLASRAHYRMIKLFSAYSMSLEKQLGSHELGGWSRYFNDDSRVPSPGTISGRMWFYDDEFGKSWNAGTRGLALSFFGPLLIIDLVFGILGFCQTLLQWPGRELV